MITINDLKYDSNGLIPAVVQDFFTKHVLMLAYMNKESLEITLEEKYTCFWSRSRNELWRKGQTSGNRQKVISVSADCDTDTLLIKIIKEGPACHTGSESCFFNELFEDEDSREFSLQTLYSIIEDRKQNPKEGSYTNYLFREGIEKILKKVGEENAEVIIAAMSDSHEQTVYEIADLCYHVFVLMLEKGILPAEIVEELAKRHKP